MAVFEIGEARLKGCSAKQNDNVELRKRYILEGATGEAERCSYKEVESKNRRRELWLFI